jgi:hypothetical protein
MQTKECKRYGPMTLTEHFEKYLLAHATFSTSVSFAPKRWCDQALRQLQAMLEQCSRHALTMLEVQLNAIDVRTNA